MHVAAVSSGDNHPYPGVNNTERWTALADSCPYPFTILGQNETWAGNKGVTNNKLFFYMKCVPAPQCCSKPCCPNASLRQHPPALPSNSARSCTTQSHDLLAYTHVGTHWSATACVLNCRIEIALRVPAV